MQQNCSQKKNEWAKLNYSGPNLLPRIGTVNLRSITNLDRWKIGFYCYFMETVHAISVLWLDASLFNVEVSSSVLHHVEIIKDEKFHHSF